MAYDEALADRIRDLFHDQPAVQDRATTEQRMFGGLGFMVGGNMAVAASSTGGLMVRVDPADGETLVATTAAEPMEMRGRSMTGWLVLAGAEVADDADLAPWVARGAAYAASLPTK